MNGRESFSGSAESLPDKSVRSEACKVGSKERILRVERSALWAAYGDALGWIGELTDSSGLMRRTGGKPLKQPIAWQRRIGGRQGISATLPQGCYSDDSQLRLATGRAIRADGFDVEAFAKVELPVWLSYGLGGGKSTSIAAAHLITKNATWWNNKFKGWLHSGGNGAAMRIQPHVWAAPKPQEPRSFLPDVVRNAVCTHSHPTGLMGAVLHALCVAHAMATGSLPSHTDIESAIEIAERIPSMIDDDMMELGYWKVTFEQGAGSFDAAWTNALTEARDAANLMYSQSVGEPVGRERYRSIIGALKLRDPSRQGSGILTALAAAGLTWCEARPAEAIRIAANELGTDTDTIASMAGAIFGATTDIDPPVEVLDINVFRAEAERLAKIAEGISPPCHQYPDLLYWSPPKARADTLVRDKDGEMSVLGLGRAKAIDEPIPQSRSDFVWRWVELDFGQTLLIKSRSKVPEAEGDQRMLNGIVDCEEVEKPRLGVHEKDARSSESLPSDAVTPVVLDKFSGTSRKSAAHHLQPVVLFAEEHINDDAAVGRALRKVVRKGTPGDIAGFTAVLIDLLRSHPKPKDTPQRSR